MAIYNFFLVIFEYTCGWKSAFLVNKRFIYYSPKSSIYYEDVPFFLCWSFWTLDNKEYEKRSCGLLSFLRPLSMASWHSSTHHIHKQTRKVFIVPSDAVSKSSLWNHSSNYGLSARTQLESTTGLSLFTPPSPQALPPAKPQTTLSLK